MNFLVKYSVRNIIREKISVLSKIILLTLATVAFIVYPTIGKSAFKTIKNYGYKDSILIMEKGNLKLAFSRIKEDIYQFVKTGPHIKKIGDKPLAAPYLQMTSVYGTKFLMLRGVTDVYYTLRGKSFKIIQGRALQDKYDILIGNMVSERLGKQFKIGDFLDLENKKWKIVGIFKVKGDPVESGAMVKLEDFKQVSAREAYSYVELKVDEPKNMPELTGYINTAFDLLHTEFPDAPAIMAIPDREYWPKLANVFKMTIMVNQARAVVIVICILLFIMNITHSALQKRTDERKILIHNGFSKGILFWGMLLETMIISTVAGLMVGFIVFSFNGTFIHLHLSTIVLKIGPSVFLRGFVIAILLGLLGNILPIIRTARQ